MDGIEVLLNFSFNTLFVEWVSINTPSIGQSRGVEDANLGEKVTRAHSIHGLRCLPICRSHLKARKYGPSWSDFDRQNHLVRFRSQGF